MTEEFAKDAPWKFRTFIDRKSWFAHIASAGKRVPMLFMDRDKGGLGLGLAHAPRDPLHVCCIGVLQHVLGNIMWLFCFTNVLPMEVADKFCFSWGRVCDIYRERQTPSQFSHLDINSLTHPNSPNSNYPLLSGKGAELRHLLLIVLSLWTEFYRKYLEY